MVGGVYYQPRQPEVYAASLVDEEDEEKGPIHPPTLDQIELQHASEAVDVGEKSGRVKDKERELAKLKAETEMLRRRLQSYRTGEVEEHPEEFVRSPSPIPGPEQLFSKVSGLYNSSFSDSSFLLQRSKAPTM
jgi:hypothetical protein